MAQTKGISYSLAAHKVLLSMGFQKPRDTSVRTALIVNDVEAEEGSSLLTAVTRKCALDGAKKRFWFPTKRKTQAAKTSTVKATSEGLEQFQLALS